MFRLSCLLLLVSPLFSTGLAAAQNSTSTADLGWVLFDQSQFDGNIALDEDGNVQFFWKTGDEYSTYGIASRSEGYLALGFSETGAMLGADIAVGSMDDAGTFQLENRFATGFVTPEISQDQTNNIRLKEGGQRDGVTAFVFEKKNKADCLREQVDVTKDSWQWFIYSFSDDNTFAQHGPGNNGKKYVKLGTGRSVSLNEIRDIPDVESFTIQQPEVAIPTEETTYCYTLHKLPEGKKNFLLGERPGNASDLLHHLVVYACYGITDELKEMVGQEPNCDYENFNNPCNGFVTEWAPGMPGRTFEPGFGKPFGSDSYEYVMLETHYNNPTGLEDQKDAVEFSFLYDDTPVDTEIGTLTLGNVQVRGWTLEPGQELVGSTTVCTAECTSRWPEDGITATSVFFHMHQRGVNARVQIIRDGQEIPLLSSIRSFDYGYQFSKSLPEIKLLPGDQLITTCEYDTSEDTEPVKGGLATKDEMCFAWVDYYPANQVLACSQVNRGFEPDNAVNGTVALCQEQVESEDGVYASENLNATFNALEVTGNTCSAAVTEENPSGTAPEAAGPTTGMASSLYGQMSWGTKVAVFVLSCVSFVL